MLAGLRDEVELRPASVHPQPLEMLRRAGLAELAAEPAPVA